MKNPNGSLTRVEFFTWQKEHQKFLDTKFGELHNQLASHIGVVDEIKKVRRQDWKFHNGIHKGEEEELDKYRDYHLDKINKSLRNIWISIVILFTVLIISHPDAVSYVGKAIAVVFK